MKARYEILGVSPHSSLEQIHRAYREKAKMLHPDAEGGDTSAFQELQNAYQEILQAHQDPPTLKSSPQKTGRRKPYHKRTYPAPEPLIPTRKNSEQLTFRTKGHSKNHLSDFENSFENIFIILNRLFR
ncbi:MAG: hypothetical protein Kow0037_10130 [Calditrichia bacterium]